MFLVTKRSLASRLAPFKEKLQSFRESQKQLRKEQLRQDKEIARLKGLVAECQNALAMVAAGPSAVAATSERSLQGQSFDLIVAPCEISDRHGTGVLLRRLFANADALWVMRPHTYYDGAHLPNARDTVFAWNDLPPADRVIALLSNLQSATVRRILVVPYSSPELEAALTLAEVFHAPLAVYVMDDNCLSTGSVPPALMQKALDRAQLRLAISPELRCAYEQHFNRKFSLLPPVVESQHLAARPAPTTPLKDASAGVLVGNIWAKAWLDRLLPVLQSAQVQVDWFGNCNALHLQTNPEILRAHGIVPRGFLPEPELAKLLNNYEFAIVPSSDLDEAEEPAKLAIGKWSLPSRIPYLMAVHRLPMLVLGSGETCAAQFIRRFDAGEVCPYEPEAFAAAVARLRNPARRQEIAQRAEAVAGTFGNEGLAEWIWQSLETGLPADDRFEQLMPRDPRSLAPYLEDPVPSQVYFKAEYAALRRLHRSGFRPGFVFDVGCSGGVWADSIHALFPEATFVLADPLLDRHLSRSSYYRDRHPEFRWEQAAVGESEGSLSLQVTSDLYRSSAIGLQDGLPYEEVPVPQVTLDSLAAKHNLTGRGVLKADVQGAEHLVLAGGRQILHQVDVVLLELTISGVLDGAKGFLEMLNELSALGFTFYDETGGWRHPVSGHRLQQDVLFVRSGLLEQLASS